jgi:hypothetical protein
MSWTSCGVDFDCASSSWHFFLSASAGESKMLYDLVSYLENNRYEYESSLNEFKFENGGGAITFYWHMKECPFILIDENTWEWIFVE